MRKVALGLTLLFVLFAFAQANANVQWDAEYYQFRFAVQPNGGIFYDGGTYFNPNGQEVRVFTNAGACCGSFGDIAQGSLSELNDTIQLNAMAKGPDGGTNPKNGVLVEGFAEIVLDGFQVNYGVEIDQQSQAWITRRFTVDKSGEYEVAANFTGEADFVALGEPVLRHHALYSYTGTVVLEEYQDGHPPTWLREAARFNFDNTTGSDSVDVELSNQTGIFYQLKALLEIDTDVQNLYLFSVQGPLKGPYQVGSEEAPFRLKATVKSNMAPVADAGPDQTVPVGATVSLDGSASQDPDGSPLTYQWSFVSKPAGSAAALSDATAVDPDFVADVAGAYEVQLIVNDGTEDSPLDTVVITTENNTPVADAGLDQTVALNATVMLDGSGSFDADGDALTYQWSFVSMPTGSAAAFSEATAVDPDFVADVAGVYEVQLIVNDGTEDSAPDAVSITVENNPPVADAGANQTVATGATATLDGSASFDPDGDPLTYDWSFVSTPAGSAAALSDPTAVAPTFDVDLDGLYVVQLIVNDGTVDSDADTVTVRTPGQNTQPVAKAGADQTVAAGANVTLDGSGSTDADGDPLTYLWSFVSMPAGSAAALSDAAAVNPTFVADLDGSYEVQLVVNDGMEDSLPDTVMVSTDNSAPVADAGDNQTVDVGATATLDGSGSTDADGDPLTYDWSFVSTPAGSAAALSDPTVVNPTFDVDLEGLYVVELIVNDGTVDSDPDRVTVRTPGQNTPPVAEAGPDQSAVMAETVMLDGSGSYDDDGDPLTYLWSFTSMPEGSAAELSDETAVDPFFEVDEEGTYVVQLIVNDGFDDSEPDTVTITTGNSAPVADAGPDQTVPVGETAVLDGSGSSDADGDLLTYLWSFTSMPEGSAAVLSDETAVDPSFEVDVAGTYVVQLIVNDGMVDSDPDTVSISNKKTKRHHSDCFIGAAGSGQLLGGYLGLLMLIGTSMLALVIGASVRKGVSTSQVKQ